MLRAIISFIAQQATYAVFDNISFLNNIYWVEDSYFYMDCVIFSLKNKRKRCQLVE